MGVQHRVPLDEVLRRIGDGEQIHTFRESHFAIFGCDWQRDDVLAAIEKYGAEDSGPGAAAMRHTLCLLDETGWLFIEAGPAEVARPE